MICFSAAGLINYRTAPIFCRTLSPCWHAISSIVQNLPNILCASSDFVFKMNLRSFNLDNMLYVRNELQHFCYCYRLPGVAVSDNLQHNWTCLADLLWFFRTDIWALVTTRRPSCLPSRVLVQKGGHGNHKLSANVKMAVVVAKLERLGVVYQQPLVDTPMLSKPQL